jgi:hypothetical protein
MPSPDGGPAFPQPQITAANGEPDFPWSGYGMGGLSLRDHFASFALIAIMSNPPRSAMDYIEMTLDAYIVADQMLKAREK